MSSPQVPQATERSIEPSLGSFKPFSRGRIRCSREETELNLLNGLQRSAGIGKRVDVHAAAAFRALSTESLSVDLQDRWKW
ncbi:hypothetical protein KCU81_g356, partial [Aureobasidium melanogenum]